MDRYKKLLSNTFLFAISTFSSKALVFLLMPLYTSMLTQAQYGTVDLIVQAANLLVPLVSLGIMNAVVRFGLDKGYSPKGVFTAGVLAIGLGYVLFVFLYPVFSNVGWFGFLSGNLLLLYLYVLTACARSLCSQFVRARNYTRLYAADGILSTVFTILFNLLFLVQMHLGVAGYLLAIIAADIASTVFLFIVAGLGRFFSLKALQRPLFYEMLRYSLPLMPTAIFWWVTNVSDRFMVTAMVSSAANGLYAVSYKIPTIVTLLSTIFTEAWQLSAVGEQGSRTLDRFFTNIFLALQGVVFCAGAALILTAKITTHLLVNPAFFAAWQYTPVLIIATVFSCFSNFLASVYMVRKKSAQNLFTMFLGAAANIALNFFLIPKLGVQGAAIATALSYFLVFTVRAFTTRRYIKIRYAPGKLLLNTALLCAQSALMLFNVKNYAFWAGLAFAGVLALNAGPILHSLKKLLEARRTSRA